MRRVVILGALAAATLLAWGWSRSRDPTHRAREEIRAHLAELEAGGPPGPVVAAVLDMSAEPAVDIALRRAVVAWSLERPETFLALADAVPPADRALFAQRFGESLASWGDPPAFRALFGGSTHPLVRAISDQCQRYERFNEESVELAADALAP